MKNILISLFFVSLSLSIVAQDEFTLVKAGQISPEFSYQTAGGKTKNLSDLKGKVVWINFFATWCGPCRKELPYLEKEVFARFENHPGFELLIIGRNHTLKEITSFKTEYNFTMPFYPDPKREIFSKYASQNIPRNFIINKKGEIANASVGFNEEDFKKQIIKLEELLNQ